MCDKIYPQKVEQAMIFSTLKDAFCVHGRRSCAFKRIRLYKRGFNMVEYWSDSVFNTWFKSELFTIKNKVISKKMIWIVIVKSSGRQYRITLK